MSDSETEQQQTKGDKATAFVERRIYTERDVTPKMRPVTKITGEPTHSQLRILKDELCCNAASAVMPQFQDTHKFGWLGILMRPTEYKQKTGESKTIPKHPGDTIDPPSGATKHQIKELQANYDRAMSRYTHYAATESALRSKLIGAVDDQYYCRLRDKYTAYNNVTTVKILEHLFNRYGAVTKAEVDEQMKIFASEWYPEEEDIDSLFKRVQDARDFLEDTDAELTDKNVIFHTRQMIVNTDEFNKGLETWDELVEDCPAQKTWEKFSDHFSKEFGKWTKRQSIKKQRANRRNESEPTVAEHGMEVTEVDPMALATVLQELRPDREELRTMINEVLAAQVVAPNRNSQSGNRNHEWDLRYRHTWAAAKQKQCRDGPARGRNSNRTLRRYSNTNYCWTHGCDVADSHDSARCNSKDIGHQDGATADNKMGGCKWFCQLTNSE